MWPLVLSALLASGGALADSSAPQVVAVELELPPGTDPSLLAHEEARDLVAVRKGQQLSLRAVRRSIERLFATGRFADVVVRAHDVPGGVRVVFEVVPKQVIAAVSVAGNRVLLEEEVLAAARLRKGAEYYPEKVREAVAAVTEALRRRGYERARTEAELAEIEGGLEVALRVEEGEPTRIVGVTVAGSPGLPLPRVLETLGLSVGDVLDLVKAEEGLDRLRALYRAESFFRARLGEPAVRPVEGGALLLLPLSAGPRYGVHFHGNRSFSDDLLRAALGYDGGETLDQGVISRMARRLMVFYRFRGFHDVRVSPRELSSPNGQRAVLAFDIEEGRPLFVREVTFTGNRRLASAELRSILTEVVRTLEPRPERSPATDDPLQLEGRVPPASPSGSPEPDPSTVFVEAAYHEAASAMAEAYRDRGFLSAKVTLARVSIDVEGKTAAVAFTIEEGPQALISEVAFTGLPEAFASSPKQELEVGAPMSHPAIERARTALARALARDGYLFARVEASPELSREGTSARVVFGVEAGPRVRVGKVLIQGLNRTREEVVRKALAVQEGDVLDPERLFDTQRNLVLLGIFRTAAVRLIAPDTAEPVKDVVVEVRELPMLSGEIGGGYFLAEGPRLVVDGVLPNAWGRAINLSGRLKIHYVGGSAQVISGLIDTSDLEGIDLFGGRMNLAAQSRSLLPGDVGVRLDVIGERVHRPSYRFTRGAIVPGVDLPVPISVPEIDAVLVKIPGSASTRSAITLQYELEHDRVASVGGAGQILSTLERADEERLRFPVGQFTLHSLRVSPTLDLRDSAVNPHAGLLVSVAGEYMRDIFTTLDKPIDTLKLSGSFNLYRELYRSWVFALSIRSGWFLPVHPESVTIAPKRFFLGGASSMRGFREDGLVPADRRAELAREVGACKSLANPAGCTQGARALLDGGKLLSEGGELFTLGKAELRFPAFGAFDLGVFLEAGNLWLSQQRYEPLELRYVAGAGLRYVTPIGPLALDVGGNLFPDQTIDEPSFQLHFNIGLF